MARCGEINKQPIWYSLYAGKTEAVDASGNYTGEHVVSYDPPVKDRMNISPASGNAIYNAFGTSTPYSKIIETDDMHTAFDVNTVWWIGKSPEAGTYNYVTVAVARGLPKSGTTKIAVREVETREPSHHTEST